MAVVILGGKDKCSEPPREFGQYVVFRGRDGRALHTDTRR